jgi:hypothetical protein
VPHFVSTRNLSHTEPEVIQNGRHSPKCYMCHPLYVYRYHPTEAMTGCNVCLTCWFRLCFGSQFLLPKTSTTPGTVETYCSLPHFLSFLRCGRSAFGMGSGAPRSANRASHAAAAVHLTTWTCYPHSHYDVAILKVRGIGLPTFLVRDCVTIV